MPSSLMTLWISVLDKSTKYNTLQSNANKQKFASTVVETPKKHKGSSGPLSLPKYERAKQKKLCYNCLSKEHEKKECPQLPCKNKDKGKEKAVYMVQKLLLNVSPKY